MSRSCETTSFPLYPDPYENSLEPVDEVGTRLITLSEISHP